MSESARDGSSSGPFGSAAPAEPVLGSLLDAALQDGPVGLETLPGGEESQGIQACEGRQVRGGEGSVRHVEVFQMGSVRTSIFGGPRPLPADRRAEGSDTLNCEEPQIWHDSASPAGSGRTTT